MTCKCGSNRIISIGCKCSDMFWMTYDGKEQEGYVPGSIGIGSGDYIGIAYCADCGQIANFKTIPEETLQSLVSDDQDDY